MSRERAVPPASRAEVCVVACAELFRGDGEILANAVGLIPNLGLALAHRTVARELLVHDGAGHLVRNASTATEPGSAVEGWLPFRQFFDVVAGGRRHAIMGANQLDRHGNQNICCIGDHTRPIKQLSGFRGAPGNSVNHKISYWIPRHDRRVFVDTVDIVSGVGFDHAAAAGPSAQRYHAPHRVVTDLAVLDFSGPGNTMRLLSVHPGLSISDVQERTGFEVDTSEVSETATPTLEQLRIIREVLDPDSLRDREIGVA